MVHCACTKIVHKKPMGAPELHWWCIDHALIVHLFAFTVPSSSLTARARLGNLDLDFGFAIERKIQKQISTLIRYLFLDSLLGWGMHGVIQKKEGKSVFRFRVLGSLSSPRSRFQNVFSLWEISGCLVWDREKCKSSVKTTSDSRLHVGYKTTHFFSIIF